MLMDGWSFYCTTLFFKDVGFSYHLLHFENSQNLGLKLSLILNIGTGPLISFCLFSYVIEQDLIFAILVKELKALNYNVLTGTPTYIIK